MSAKLCPFKNRGPDMICDEERCACWDDGVYDTYMPGCGMVPRDSRRA